MTQSRKAFVLMPFREPFESYYDAIFKPALEAAGFTVHRPADLYASRPIMLDIQDNIIASDLILCELTGRNPNVFYELGLAHAVGKPTILVSTTEEDIPFDLRHVRVLHYDPLRAGWEPKLLDAIEKSARQTFTSGDVWPPPLTVRSNVSREPGKQIEPREPEREGWDSRIVDRPINLGFDGAVDGNFPHGWFNSVGHVSNVSNDYAVRVVDREDRVPGKCLMIYKAAANRSEFGSVMQRFPAEFLAGRTIRLEGDIRTQDVDGWAGLWLRADGREMPGLFFDNMSGHRVAGTTPWTRYSIDARIPPATAWLNVGVVFSGSGIMWADNLRLLSWTSEGNWRDV